MKAHLLVVWTMESFDKPAWFCIRDFIDLSLDPSNQLRFFVVYYSDLETLVLGSFEDLVTMQAKECFGCILSR